MVTLDRQGKLTGLETLSPAHQQIVQQALLKETVELPRLPSELSPRTGPLLGARAPGGAFALLSPVGVVVEAARPTFRWRPLSGAASYNVKIYDANLQMVAQSGPLATTSWTVPKLLARGQVYGWSVTALKDGVEITSPAPPAPEAKFQALDQAKIEELEQARRDYGDRRLLLGLLYARAGLRAEAEREFRALAQANPDSPVAQKLWRSLSAR
jgi:hypothetical protein